MNVHMKSFQLVYHGWLVDFFLSFWVGRRILRFLRILVLVATP